LDNELVDAIWYTREEIKAILAHPEGARITRQEYKKFDDEDTKKGDQSQNSQQPPSTTSDSAVSQTSTKPLPPFRVPPTTAIAGVLIRDWAEGRYGNGSAVTATIGQSKSSNL